MIAARGAGPLTPAALGALAQWQVGVPYAAVLAAWGGLALLPHDKAHGSLTGWALMTVAMMGPLVAPVLASLTARVYDAQRFRVWTWAALGYGAVWLAAGAVVIPAALALHRLTGHAAHPWIGSAGFAAAALWQLTPAKRAALRRCHVVTALPVGPGLERAAWRFGLRHGLACFRACGPLMAAVAIAGGQLWIMVWVSALILAERTAHRPPVQSVAAMVALLAATLALAALVWNPASRPGHVTSHGSGLSAARDAVDGPARSAAVRSTWLAAGLPLSSGEADQKSEGGQCRPDHDFWVDRRSWRHRMIRASRVP